MEKIGLERIESMKLIDLTHMISEDMPVFPGTRPPLLKVANTVEEHGFKEHLLTMYSHTGTHIDAPSHMESERENLDDFPIDKYFGQALVIDARSLKGKRIEIEDVKPHEEILEQVDFVIFRTGWEELWGKIDYYEAFPTPTVEVAQYLAGFKLKGIGIDAISIDPMDDYDFLVHHEIFKNRMLIIENLTNLESIGSDRFNLSIFPLKNRGADGSPVRAVAMIEEGRI